MGACLESMGARVIDDRSAAGLAQGLASLARCVVEQPETVIQVLRKLLSAAVWQKMPGTVFRVANLAKKALTRYLVLAEATFTIADVVTTLALPRSAFTVSLFPRTDATGKLPFVGSLGRSRVSTGYHRRRSPVTDYASDSPLAIRIVLIY
jgi:hypothetical protein